MLNHNLPLMLTIWMIVIALMAVVRRRKGTAGVGLVLAYLLNFWMLFWFASLLYLLPWYHGPFEEFTIVGTEQSLYGVLGFAFGSLALSPFLLDSGLLPRARGIHRSDRRLPKAYLVTGAISYMLLAAFLGRVLSLNAILSSGQQLVVVGLSLCCWQAWQSGDARKTTFWLSMALMMPVITIVTRGYIGYGATATLSVLIFLSCFVRRRIKVVITGVLLGYLAISVFVTYMRDRIQIRQSVWGGQSLSDRVERVTETAAQFEWFDPFNNEHLQRIDGRLNQSYLVGAAVAHLDQYGDFAHGETLRDAALALIPRIFWPDKPIEAGSGTLVAHYTGLMFDNSTTSVGIGQVMEFYVNFGTAGVIVGFMIFGLILTTLDVLATERLASGDLHGFVLFYLPGLSFLPVVGQLTEITASAAASLVVALLVNRVLDKLQRKRDERGESTDITNALHHTV
jgi:hypothetical protein